MLEMREKEICRRTIKRDVKVLSKGTDVMKSDLVSTRRRLHSLKNGCCSDRVVDYSIKELYSDPHLYRSRFTVL